MMPRERALDGLRRGLSRAAACRQAGVGRSSFYRWQREDPDYAAAVLDAEAAYWAAALAEVEALYPPPTPPSTTITVEERRPDGSLAVKRVVPRSQVEIAMQAAAQTVPFPDAARTRARGRARGVTGRPSKGSTRARPRNG